MMSRGNFRMALAAIRSAKWRSLLTVLGIIIGVVSVVTTVSLGEGVKRQVAGQVNHLGKGLITIRPGAPTPKSTQPLAGLGATASTYGQLGSTTLSEGDVETVRAAGGLGTVVPVGVASGIAQVEDRQVPGGTIIATGEGFAATLNQKVEFGSYFSRGELNRKVVVIGKRVAEQLFQENVPIGHTLTIRGQDFIVRGVFDEFETNVLAPGTDLNKAVYVPYPTAKAVTGGNVPIAMILAKADKPDAIEGVASDIRTRLRKAHAGQEDFSVLGVNENLAITGEVVNTITQLVAGIAAISLLVGGVGIMNIMLVSVTERTREIGIRKAVGATNRQILSQFLVEAAVLGFVGGLAGIVVAIMANFGIRIFTNLHPVVTLPVILIAAGASWAVGVVFGVAPAVEAARKDPIDALRYE